jgi:hypothetical protein
MNLRPYHPNQRSRKGEILERRTAVMITEEKGCSKLDGKV